MLCFVTMLVGGVRDDIYVASGSRFGCGIVGNRFVYYVGVSCVGHEGAVFCT